MIFWKWEDVLLDILNHNHSEMRLEHNTSQLSMCSLFFGEFSSFELR